MGANIGYQTWMDLGTLYNNGCHMYTGMKLENSNRYDAVINWGNDLAGVGGPDFLRFIFTQIGGGAPTAGQAFDGEEVARFAPTGNTGLGNFWAYGANTVPNRRLELLDADPNSTTRANQDLPQLRLTYLYNPIVTSGIWTDFQTQDNGNLQINTSNDGLPQRVGINNGTAALTRTFDVNGNLRLRTLPQAQFNANGNAAINRVMVANANGEVFWRDDIGPGGAGIITADNGLSRTPNNSNVQLGQIVGAALRPGRLIHTTEIPMDNFNLYFTDHPTAPIANLNSIGIGTITPLAKFHVNKSGITNFNGNHVAGYFSNSDNSFPNFALDATGIYAECTGDNKNNTGANFTARNSIGRNTGAFAAGISTTSTAYGGDFLAVSNSNTAIGVNALAASGTNLEGVHARASAGTNYNYGINTIGSGGVIAEGIHAHASNSSDKNYGVNSEAYGGLEAIGVRAFADNGSVANYAIYAEAGLPNQSNSDNCAGYFNGDAYAVGVFFTSDSILKTNVKNFNSGLSIINAMKTKEYEFDQKAFPSMRLPSGIHHGLIAQDLEKIMPELVRNFTQPLVLDTLGAIKYPAVKFKAVNYTELIPILIAGMQEQDAKINNLQTQLNTCCSSNKNTGNTNHTITTKLSDIATIILDQNEPNPFAEETNVNYFIPESAGKAEIMFYQTMAA